MGWHIALIKNDVKVSKKLAKEIWKATTYVSDEVDSNGTKFDDYNPYFDSEDSVTYGGFLNFNSDHMEHMDYLGNESKIVKILTKGKVSGEILFGSLDGDDNGEFWGYRWVKGKFTKLKGEVVFKPTK